MITLLIIASTTIMFVDRPCIKEYPTEILQGCYHPDTEVIEIANHLTMEEKSFAIRHEFAHKMVNKAFSEGKFASLSNDLEEVCDMYAFWLQNPIIVGKKWNKIFKEI
jgi:Zn-dependent peptidase ImmA (M78 family)